VESNSQIYDYIKDTRANIQAAGEIIDEASQNIDTAANISNINSSRWSLLGTVIGAGSTAAAASICGGGMIVIDGAAAIGALTRMALVFAAVYVGKTAFEVLTKRSIGASKGYNSQYFNLFLTAESLSQYFF
jgi:hypothetical protein